MKHLKKCFSLALTALLLLGISIPALASVEDTGFSDVDADAWYAEAVIYCREHGLMEGNPDNTFEPEGDLTRAALVTVLYRMAGSPAVAGALTFPDTVRVNGTRMPYCGPPGRSWSRATSAACSGPTIRLPGSR